MKKVFLLAHNWVVFLVLTIYYVPILFFIVYLLIQKEWWRGTFIFLLLVISNVTQVTYSLNFIVIKKGIIYSPHSLSRFPSLQKKVKVNISDIIYVDFGYELVTTYAKGWIKESKYRCLKLYLKDEKIEKIFIIGFTNRQLKKLEKALKENNENLLFEHESDYYKSK